MHATKDAKFRAFGWDREMKYYRIKRTLHRAAVHSKSVPVLLSSLLIRLSFGPRPDYNGNCESLYELGKNQLDNF